MSLRRPGRLHAAPHQPRDDGRRLSRRPPRPHADQNAERRSARLRLQGRELAPGRHRRRLLGARRRAPARHLAYAGRGGGAAFARSRAEQREQHHHRRDERRRKRPAAERELPPPEVVAASADAHYAAAEAERYTAANERTQRELAARAVQLLGLAAGRRVLADLGCGSGLSCDAAAGHAVVGLDVARDMLALAAARRAGELYTPTSRPGSRCGRAARSTARSASRLCSGSAPTALAPPPRARCRSSLWRSRMRCGPARRWSRSCTRRRRRARRRARRRRRRGLATPSS